MWSWVRDCGSGKGGWHWELFALAGHSEAGLDEAALQQGAPAQIVGHGEPSKRHINAASQEGIALVQLDARSASDSQWQAVGGRW